MGTVVAVDVGTVRVGCAVADDAVRIPFPVAIWAKAGGTAERAVIETLRERSAEALVVGLPLGMNGEEGTLCDVARSFVRRILKRHPIVVHFVDESFSSDEARALSRQKGPLDSSAACLILDRYFNHGPVETVS